MALVVDLDGTLTPCDTLVENIAGLARSRPAALLGLWPALLRGRAALKLEVSDAMPFDPASVPYREDLLQYIAAQKAAGRRIVLATAADRQTAQAVAAHLGTFDDVLATEQGVNLKGSAKLAAIHELVGSDFHYAGDSAADMAVWLGSTGAVLVGPGRRFRDRLEGRIEVVAEFGPPANALMDWALTMRLHHWLKNVLVFVPMLTGDARFDMAALATLLAAFLTFGLLASATYVINDTLDLPSDRSHPRKRERPIACGRISVQRAWAGALAFVATAVLICAFLPPRFSLMLGAYALITITYTAWIKRKVLLDVITLAVLYTTRVLAGAAVLSISVSAWLLAFSATVFFSLALVKRCAELVAMQRDGHSSASGRDYQVNDLTILWSLGCASAMCAVLVFGLFISQGQTLARYATPDLLWLVALSLTYWLSRLWVKTSRGEMHDDPLVYTLVDRDCQVTMAVIVLTTLVARFTRL